MTKLLLNIAWWMIFAVMAALCVPATAVLCLAVFLRDTGTMMKGWLEAIAKKAESR
jgi:hypothetical protein